MRTLLLSMLCAGCGVGAGAVDAGAESANAWPNDAVGFNATYSQGFGEMPCRLPDGGFHRVSLWELSLDAGTLHFDVCRARQADAGFVLVRDEGTTVLDAGSLGAIELAVRGLQRSTRSACGADKPTQTLSVRRAGGSEVVLKDEFYACTVMSPELAVSGIDEVFTVLGKVTP